MLYPTGQDRASPPVLFRSNRDRRPAHRSGKDVSCPPWGAGERDLSRSVLYSITPLNRRTQNMARPFPAAPRRSASRHAARFIFSFGRGPPIHDLLNIITGPPPAVNKGFAFAPPGPANFWSAGGGGARGRDPHPPPPRCKSVGAGGGVGGGKRPAPPPRCTIWSCCRAPPPHKFFWAGAAAAPRAYSRAPRAAVQYCGPLWMELGTISKPPVRKRPSTSSTRTSISPQGAPSLPKPWSQQNSLPSFKVK